MAKGSEGTRTKTSNKKSDGVSETQINDVIKNYEIEINQTKHIDGRNLKTYYEVSYNFGTINDKTQLNNLIDICNQKGGKYDWDMDAFNMLTNQDAQYMTRKIAESIIKKNRR